MNKVSIPTRRRSRSWPVPAAAALALFLLVSPAVGQNHRQGGRQDRHQRMEMARPGGHRSMRFFGGRSRVYDGSSRRYDRRFFGGGHAFRSRTYGGRGWWAGTPRIIVRRNPYYYSSNTGLWIGGLALDNDLYQDPPNGYNYYDPYCQRNFLSLAAYRDHARGYHHPCAVTLIRVSGSWGE